MKVICSKLCFSTLSKYLSKACLINVISGSVRHMKLMWETQDKEEGSHKSYP